MLCDQRVLPVLEQVAAQLRKEGLLDVRFSSAPGIDILGRADKEKADVIIVEGKEAVALAVHGKLARSEDFISLAGDRLVVVAKASKEKLDPIRLLRMAKPGRIVTTGLESSILGLHTQSALKRIGLWDALKSRIKAVLSPKDAVEKIKTDKADAAIVYLTDIAGESAVRSVLTFPKQSYYPILYFGAPTRHAKNTDQARGFLYRLVGNESASFWIQAGFQPPPKDLP